MTQPESRDSLLLTLEEISRLVSHSHDPGETLGNIVHLLQSRFGTDVCSVYLLDRDGLELTLGATVGLASGAVGTVRMRIDEGLTGLVVQELRPVMVEDALRHPRFKYFPEAGEDPYHSFLGVPLIERGVPCGVLVLQTVDPRPFSADESRMLVAAACQLAPLVGSAGLLQRVLAATHAVAGPEPKPVPSGPLRGTPLSPGIGIGQACCLEPDSPDTDPPPSSDPAHERSRFEAAVRAASAELDGLSRRISELVGEDHGAILQAQLMILQDRTLERDVVTGIDAGLGAEASLRQTLERYSAAFRRLSSPLFQERVFDVKDVARRLLWHLRPVPAGPSPEADRIVLVSPEVSVMELFAFDLEKLAGVVVGRGGPQSHAAILARSLGIPMVGQVSFPPGDPPRGRLCVDGDRGLVEALAADRVVASPGPTRFGDLAGQPPGPLPEGAPSVHANINLLSEAAAAVRFGAEGVGLYRTEMIFLARRTLPTEDQQLRLYRKLVQRFPGQPVNIRTFDLRPEKVHPQLAATAGDSLDWRRVLASPSMQQVFRDQVMAISRTGGGARILVPLVTSSEQLDFVLEVVGRTRAELDSEGPPPPLGVMIEAPAASALVRQWGAEVDFFAVGTNDLVASALGVERLDAAVSEDLSYLHPGVLRLLADVIEAGQSAGRPVCICGEMAGEPLGALALTALGADMISVAAHRLPGSRRLLSSIEPAALQRLAPELLAARSAGVVRSVLGPFADVGPA